MTIEHLTALAQTWGYNPNDVNFQGAGGLVKWLTQRLAVALLLEEEGNKALEDRVQFTLSWWGSRMAEMDAWIRKHADDATKQAYFGILANGYPSATRHQVSSEERAIYARLLCELDEARKREENLWLDAPNAAAGFWWWDNGREVEMVEAREVYPGHICLYSCTKEWGGHTLDLAREHLRGRWQAVTKPTSRAAASKAPAC